MRVPVDSYTHESVVRRSRFIAEGRPLEDPRAVRQIAAEVRRSHQGCDHVVWAYVYGPAGENVGLSDDREPHGTAGRPLLDALQGAGVTNILLTVTRYFGGTKLGTGGLVRAYGDAAKGVLSAIELREHVERRRFLLDLPYDAFDTVRRLSRELGVIVEQEGFSDRVHLEGSVPLSAVERFRECTRDATAGRSEPRFLG